MRVQRDSSRSICVDCKSSSDTIPYTVRLDSVFLVHFSEDLLRLSVTGPYLPDSSRLPSGGYLPRCPSPGVGRHDLHKRYRTQSVSSAIRSIAWRHYAMLTLIYLLQRIMQMSVTPEYQADGRYCGNSVSVSRR